jgi:hypothetical protein
MSLLAGICEPGRLLAFMEAATQESTGDLLQRIRDDLHPGQLEFVDDNQTQILGISAGYGAGKTQGIMRQGGDASGGQPRLHWCGDGAHGSADS